MKEIEEKVYKGGLPRQGTYHSVFRQIFDVDGDGFISHADFEGACKKLQVKADSQSVLHAIRALDTDQKGYFDYKTFSKNWGPGMSERLAKLAQSDKGIKDLVHLPQVGLSKTTLNE